MPTSQLGPQANFWSLLALLKVRQCYYTAQYSASLPCISVFIHGLVLLNAQLNKLQMRGNHLACFQNSPQVSKAALFKSSVNM